MLVLTFQSVGINQSKKNQSVWHTTGAEQNQMTSEHVHA